MLVRVIEAEIPKRGLVGRFRPRMFTRDAEHRGHRVVAERHDGTPMLAAGTGDIDVAVNDDVRVVRSQCAYLGILK